MDKLVNVSRAAEMLGCSTKALRQWDKEGKVNPVRTAGGHRRYRLSDIEKLQGVVHEEVHKPYKEVVAQYSRVSSHEQKEGDLDRQTARLTEHCAKKDYHVAHVLTDVGSGMSSNRSRLKRLFELVESHEITKVVIEHKDRLTRFNFGVYERFFASHGVTIEWMDSGQSKMYEQELVDDMVSLMSSFSSKIYGKRSAENEKKRKMAKLAVLSQGGLVPAQQNEVVEV
jgi:predicted site-specific integrase-resolvase